MERVMEIKLSNEYLIEEFVKDCKLRGLTKETIRNYKSQLKIFNQFLEGIGKDILNIDRDALREFIGYLKEIRGNSSKRIENYFSALSSFYDFLVYEKIVEKNHVLEVRKRYLRKYKKNLGITSPRKIISVEEMSALINSILDIRDRALAALLAKTGIRRGELIRIDLDDVNWEEMSITLKPTPKRSNRIVFFDDECARILKKWIAARKEMKVEKGCKALFVNNRGGRLKRNGVYSAIVKWAEKVGVHDPNSDKIEDHFSPHCFRHWFTTHLLRNGMPREHVKELRGDARNEAIDIYHHIDREELRRAYLTHIPQLGIE